MSSSVDRSSFKPLVRQVLSPRHTHVARKSANTALSSWSSSSLHHDGGITRAADESTQVAQRNVLGAIDRISERIPNEAEHGPDTPKCLTSLVDPDIDALGGEHFDRVVELLQAEPLQSRPEKLAATKAEPGFDQFDGRRNTADRS